jgi:hypothetical protein
VLLIGVTAIAAVSWLFTRGDGVTD